MGQIHICLLLKTHCGLWWSKTAAVQLLEIVTKSFNLVTPRFFISSGAKSDFACGRRKIVTKPFSRKKFQDFFTFVLFLSIFSVNCITTLADIQCCKNLQELYIRKNKIPDLNEVCWLRDLTKLKNLWLEENPACNSTQSDLWVFFFKKNPLISIFKDFT